MQVHLEQEHSGTAAGVPYNVAPGTEMPGKCGRWDVQERHLERKCHRTMTGVPGRAVLGIKREEAEDTESRAVSLLLQKAAAAYSPTWWGSTIGAAGLNFSVRYG